jgi:tetratricopeptide (TPR) repeat protein
MPGIPGFLGVCFGRVITANSPAAQAANPTNWEAVLWHEFCHVVTLELTRNRMPRWLSEGISVYEERLADPRWGQTMTPAYRQRILEGGLVPVADLSSAFLTPGADIQFAYYQSSLVVEFLIAEYGLEAMKSILGDLAEGLPINEALPRYTNDLPVIEEQFAQFAKAQAESLASEADWSSPDIAGIIVDDDSEALMREWVAKNPHNVRGLMTFAALLIENERWDEAKQTLHSVIDLYPGYIGSDSPYVLLAEIHAKLGETDLEGAVLEDFAARDADAGAVYLRLIELAEQQEDWDGLHRNAERLMAVNPLTPHPHQAIATVAEVNEQPEVAMQAYRSLLAMEPDDPAELHYRLAHNYQRLDSPVDAKRHVLMALENAPRFRDAQRLLLRLVETTPKGKNDTSEDPPSPAETPLMPELVPDPTDPSKSVGF